MVPPIAELGDVAASVNQLTQLSEYTTMDRRVKATQNRDKAPRLNKEWGVGAVQVRYSDDGHWYGPLSNFPAALFDAHGYILFDTEDEYLSCPHLGIGKITTIKKKPGISALPGYVHVTESIPLLGLDVDVHSAIVTEGQKELVIHLRRERNQSIVRKKKKETASLDCEICGFSFSRIYGSVADSYCEVHHLIPLSEAANVSQTRLEDLAILCANCHRVVHLQSPPYTIAEVKAMLTPVKLLRANSHCLLPPTRTLRPDFT